MITLRFLQLASSSGLQIVNFPSLQLDRYTHHLLPLLLATHVGRKQHCLDGHLCPPPQTLKDLAILGSRVKEGGREEGGGMGWLVGLPCHAGEHGEVGERGWFAH